MGGRTNTEKVVNPVGTSDSNRGVPSLSTLLHTRVVDRQEQSGARWGGDPRSRKKPHSARWTHVEKCKGGKR